jgi:hypothetical protein
METGDDCLMVASDHRAKSRDTDSAPGLPGGVQNTGCSSGILAFDT